MATEVTDSEAATDPLLVTLRDTFGFPGFRAGQEPVVRALLAGRSALAVFPTGAGKSLCYQLAALHLPGLTVVVSPLIALMKDQLGFLESRGVPAGRVDSSRDAAQLRQTTADLRAGRLKLLYASPERLGNERFLATLRGAGTISLLVVDEAHCISEWGHNFRPDYLKLARLAQTLRAERVLALTATATPAVAADIARSFGIADADVVHTGFHRPNLFLRVTPVSKDEALPRLTARLREQSRPPGATVVYVTLQKTAETVAAALAAAGFDARPYHAGLEDEARAATQDWFMTAAERAPIVVATIAFGMGIDKPDLRYVYHFNLPKSLENYSQEIGRAGRDGLPAECELFACADDLLALENFSYGDTPEPAHVAALTARLLVPNDDGTEGGETFDVSLYELADECDIRPLVVGTLLTYLELADVLAATAPFYREYAFVPQRPSAEILARFEGERREFLRAVLRLAKRGPKWFRLDLDEAAKTIPGATRERLVRAFNYLEEHGDLEIRLTGLRQGFRRLRRSENGSAELTALQADLARRFETREANDLGRLRQVVAFAEAPGCLTRRLVGYFGEELAGDCGHCARCASEPAAPLPPRTTRPSAREIRAKLAEIAALAEKHPAALGTPRQRTRFACGLSSPRTSRARLTTARGKNGLFGCLAEARFTEVLEATRVPVGP